MELLAHFGHMISQSYMVSLILILGYLGCDRKKFAQIITVTMFSVVTASFLKAVFQVPLPPGINGSWALPSGHMMPTFVMWFSLAWAFRSKWMFILAIFISICTGYSLVFYGYHHPIDVYAAVGIGIIIMAVFYLILAIWPNKKIYEAYLFFGVLSLVINYFNKTPEIWSYHIWNASATIFGISLGWAITSSNKINADPSKVFKLARVVIGIVGFAIFYYIFTNLDIDLTEPTTAFFQYFLLSLWVSLFTDQLCKSLSKVFVNGPQKHKK